MYKVFESTFIVAFNNNRPGTVTLDAQVNSIFRGEKDHQDEKLDLHSEIDDGMRRVQLRSAEYCVIEATREDDHHDVDWNGEAVDHLEIFQHLTVCVIAGLGLENEFTGFVIVIEVEYVIVKVVLKVDEVGRWQD